MKLHANIKINGKTYKKGSEISWFRIYPFFLLHLLIFGGSGFIIAYGDNAAPLLFLYAHGGIAILSYVAFYLVMFGRDEVKWMLINAALGFFGMYSQIDWILAQFDKQVSDFEWVIHVIPFLYYILYTFLIRQAVLDFTRSRDNEVRRTIVGYFYIALSTLIYFVAWMV